MNEKLIKKVREKLDCKSNAETEKTVSIVLNSIFEILQEEKNLRFGIGTFKVSFRKERKGINPQTKKEMIIPAKKLITFKLSKSFSDNLNKK